MELLQDKSASFFFMYFGLIAMTQNCQNVSFSTRLVDRYGLSGVFFKPKNCVHVDGVSCFMLMFPVPGLLWKDRDMIKLRTISTALCCRSLQELG